MGICYPLLKEIDITIPVSKQKGYNNEYGRYWTKPILEINNKYYILCSQWFKEFQDKLDSWTEQNNKILDNVTEKKKIYVLPKAKTKICQKCGIKTESDILFIIYRTTVDDINNKLFTRKCSNCNVNYISDNLYKTYIKSKDKDAFNVEFIE